MNYKFILVGLAMTISYAPFALAQVYQCTSGNRITFTGTPGKGCVLLDKSKLGFSVISTPEASRGDFTGTQNSNVSNNDANTAKITQAQQELRDAQRALEEGKKIRLGNERNFVRFQERIQSLQGVVDQKQNQLNVLQQNAP